MPALITTGPRADRQREIYGKVYAFCGTCGQPLEPCPAGGDAAVMHGPRFIGFNPCCPRRGCGGEPDITLGSQHESIYLTGEAV